MGICKKQFSLTISCGENGGGRDIEYNLYLISFE